MEFRRLGVRRTGHAGELGIQAEVILEGDRGEGLVLGLDGHTLLGLDRLVQPLGPAAARQGAAGELVDDDHLLVAHDVLDIAAVDGVRTQGSVEVMHQHDVLGVIQALALGQKANLAQQHLGLLVALLGEVDLLLLLVDGEVAALLIRERFLALLRLLARLALELGDQAVDGVVQLGVVRRGTGDDQRGAGLVDQDGIHLIHDGEVERALHDLIQAEGHVVAQVVEAQLVVGGVGDVAGIGIALGAVVHARHHDAHRQSERVVQPPHPLGVAAGQVIVDGDHVHALAGQRVEVGGQGRDQGLALAGAHLADLALVQHHAADQLHVEVAHTEHPAAGLAADGEGLDQ